jgi:hypothetical protein
VHKISKEKKTKTANVTARIKAKGALVLVQQSEDKSESETLYQAYDFGKLKLKKINGASVVPY